MVTNTEDSVDRVQSLCGLAWHHLDRDCPDDAVMALESALAVPPATVAAYLTIAEAAEAARAPRLAFRAFQAARLSFPTDPEPRRRLAQRLLDQQRYRLAALVAVADRPELEPLAALDVIAAAAWHASGDYGRALEAAERACQCEAPPPEAMQLRAFCLSAVVEGPEPLDDSKTPFESDIRSVSLTEDLPQNGVRRATLAGDLSDFPLPSLLEFLALQSKTGVLSVFSLDGAPLSRLWLSEGTLFGSWSPDQHPLEQALGLDRALFVDDPESSERFVSALDCLAVFGEAPGTQREQAEALLANHAVRVIKETLLASGGRVEFKAFEADPAPLSVDSRGPLLEALRKIDEENRHGAG